MLPSQESNETKEQLTKAITHRDDWLQKVRGYQLGGDVHQTGLALIHKGGTISRTKQPIQQSNHFDIKVTANTNADLYKLADKIGKIVSAELLTDCKSAYEVE